MEAQNDVEESYGFHDRAERGARGTGGRAGHCAGPGHDLLREQHRFRHGRQSRRIGRGRQALSGACREGRRRESNVAGVSQHQRCPTSTRAIGSEADPGRTPRASSSPSNVAELHSDKANINNDTALDEQGRPINPQGAPNRHDILTGSTADGRATTMTCQNWTSSASDQSRDARASRSSHVRQAWIALELGPPVQRAARRRTWSRPAEPG